MGALSPGPCLRDAAQTGRWLLLPEGSYTKLCAAIQDGDSLWEKGQTECDMALLGAACSVPWTDCPRFVRLSACHDASVLKLVEMLLWVGSAVHKMPEIIASAGQDDCSPSCTVQPAYNKIAIYGDEGRGR